MERSKREIEIKLRFDSPDQARRLLERSGARLVGVRTFEDNVVYDDEHGTLVSAGKLLRLRRYGEQATLTFKAPVEGESRHKIREEHETAVGEPSAVEDLLAGLGFKPVYRYQKFRTLYRADELEASIDETPLGCFVELEGDPGSIDRVAGAMGFSGEHYVVATYRELQEEQARSRGVAPGDLVFAAGTEGRP